MLELGGDGEAPGAVAIELKLPPRHFKAPALSITRLSHFEHVCPQRIMLDPHILVNSSAL